MKTCIVCGKSKPINSYYKKHAKCKSCYMEHKRGTYDPIKQRDKNLKHLYGIGIKEYNELLESQGGVCACCGTKNPKGRQTGRGGAITNFYVDHSHTTGKVRGLLCNACNRALGNIGDNIHTLQNMIEYLNTH